MCPVIGRETALDDDCAAGEAPNCSGSIEFVDCNSSIRGGYWTATTQPDFSLEARRSNRPMPAPAHEACF